jgi:hypothetical protein
MNNSTQKPERVHYWTLVGRLTPDNRLKYIPPILTTFPPRQLPVDFSSRLKIELLDENDRLLVSQAVPIAYYCPDQPHTIKDIAIRTKVPFHKDTKTIRFWNGEVLVKEWQRPDRGPEIENLAVKREQGRIQLTWQAHHPEGKEIQYVVRFSKDGGNTFNRLSKRLNQPQYEIAENQIPGGKGWIFQVAATDGVNTTTVDSEPLDLPETPPLLEISEPPDGSQVPVGRSVLFHGELIAFLGEDIGIKSVRWTSDRDGTLSDRLIFETDQLSKGTHGITLAVEDSQKRKLSSSISLHVV